MILYHHIITSLIFAQNRSLGICRESSSIYIRTSFNSCSVIKLRRISFVIALLCCSTLCFSGLAASPISIGLDQIKQSDSDLSSYVTNTPARTLTDTTSVQQENNTLLKQDSGTNLTEMNDNSPGNAPINDAATSSQATQEKHYYIETG